MGVKEELRPSLNFCKFAVLWLTRKNRRDSFVFPAISDFFFFSSGINLVLSIAVTVLIRPAYKSVIFPQKKKKKKNAPKNQTRLYIKIFGHIGIFGKSGGATWSRKVPIIKAGRKL